MSDPDDFIAPPVPVVLELYDAERARHFLDYAAMVLTHPTLKLSPLAKDTLHGAIVASKVLIKLDDKEANKNISLEQQRLLRQHAPSHLRTAELLMHRYKYLQLRKTKLSSEIMEKIIILQKLLLFVRYGEHLKECCYNVDETKPGDGKRIWEKIVKWNTLPLAYWKEIEERLLTEKDIWRQECESGNSALDLAKYPTRAALEDALEGLKLIRNKVLQELDWYLQTKAIIWGDIQDMCFRGKVVKLQVLLLVDLASIEKLFTRQEREEALLLCRTICTKIRNFLFLDQHWGEWASRREKSTRATFGVVWSNSTP